MSVVFRQFLYYFNKLFFFKGFYILNQRYGSLPGILHMIELEKGRTGLGLSLAGNRDRSRMSVNDTGVFVSDIVKGGLADTDGRLMQGDQILSVNGEDVSHSQAVTLLKNATGTVQLQVGEALTNTHSYVDGCSSLSASSGGSLIIFSNVSSAHLSIRPSVLEEDQTDWVSVLSGGTAAPMETCPSMLKQFSER
uniref:PDZ domain-containing protein n=1 Tax=Mola mola TaxID=94237 RepID=A0A3Q3WL64_MOLML